MRTIPIFHAMAAILFIHCLIAPPAAQGSALNQVGLRAWRGAILADTPKVRARAELLAGRVLLRLREAVRAGDLKEQIESIEWLGSIGDYAKSASEDLVKLLAGDQIRSRAVAALAAIAKDALPELARGLKSKNSLVRQNCAALIGQLGADGHSQVRALEKLARSDPSAGVRAEARAALKKIGSP